MSSYSFKALLRDKRLWNFILSYEHRCEEPWYIHTIIEELCSPLKSIEPYRTIQTAIKAARTIKDINALWRHPWNNKSLAAVQFRAGARPALTECQGPIALDASLFWQPPPPKYPLIEPLLSLTVVTSAVLEGSRGVAGIWGSKSSELELVQRFTRFFAWLGVLCYVGF